MWVVGENIGNEIKIKQTINSDKECEIERSWKMIKIIQSMLVSAVPNPVFDDISIYGSIQYSWYEKLRWVVLKQERMLGGKQGVKTKVPRLSEEIKGW